MDAETADFASFFWLAMMFLALAIWSGSRGSGGGDDDPDDPDQY